MDVQTQIMIWQVLSHIVLIGGLIVGALLALFIAVTFAATMYPFVVKWLYWVKKKFSYEHCIIEPNDHSSFMNGGNNDRDFGLLVLCLLLALTLSLLVFTNI